MLHWSVLPSLWTWNWTESWRCNWLVQEERKFRRTKSTICPRWNVWVRHWTKSRPYWSHWILQKSCWSIKSKCLTQTRETFPHATKPNLSVTAQSRVQWNIIWVNFPQWQSETSSQTIQASCKERTTRGYLSVRPYLRDRRLWRWKDRILLPTCKEKPWKSNITVCKSSKHRWRIGLELPRCLLSESS